MLLKLQLKHGIRDNLGGLQIQEIETYAATQDEIIDKRLLYVLISFVIWFCLLAALNPELKTTLDKVVTSHKVILFMKGTKDFPQCGFSNTVVQILKTANVPFETINILDNEMLRQGLKEYSQWPTFPQLYIDGEFFGGCDITVEAYKSGELQELLEKASLS